MFKTKNLSPQYLAFLAAFFISFIVAISFGIATNSYTKAAVSFIVFLTTIYLFLRYIFNWFIYRRIKLIYKLIYHTKANKKAESYYKYILPNKKINEVEDEVEQWANQHATEIELQQKSEVYRKEFLQNLSHELKTPVFAIQGYIETILDDLEDNHFHKNFLQKANNNVARMTLLLKDLDEISKLETGEQPLSITKFIIQDLIKEVFETLSIKIKKNNITPQIKKGCEQSIYVCADKEKIRQVISNLILNASKYGKQNGNIFAGIYKTDDKNVLIEISDDGIGIEEEHLQRIFERFYRTDNARSRNIGGSGLGLAICKHIIEAHQQTIHVRSKPNVGTTIGFTLNAK
jgi:two-component system, OmpR family, phosphate regulon sensor histidine kinase PhoR